MESAIQVHYAPQPPRVSCYQRSDAADFCLTLQVGGESAVIRWGAEDDPAAVAKRLREIANWVEQRS